MSLRRMFSQRKRPLFLCIVGLLCVTRLMAAVTPTKEYYVKAAYLYNFSKFVSWPEEILPPESPLHVCILGYQEFSGALDTIRNKSAQGHLIEIVEIAEWKPTLIPQCHILYLSQKFKNEAAAILGQVQNAPILTVSDIKPEGEILDLLHVQLLDDEKHILFNINMAAIKQAGLIMSSKLARLARTVISG